MWENVRSFIRARNKKTELWMMSGWITTMFKWTLERVLTRFLTYIQLVHTSKYLGGHWYGFTGCSGFVGIFSYAAIWFAICKLSGLQTFHRNWSILSLTRTYVHVHWQPQFRCSMPIGRQNVHLSLLGDFQYRNNILQQLYNEMHLKYYI